MSASLWTSAEIARAVNGRPSGPDFAAHGVAIDSREVQAGDLFVALSGARDGHAFVPAALAAGAAGSLTSQPAPGPT
ncbi:MAG TPA: Mur ligase domain-containing protein, partial [Caulobacteraceae bacterium]